MKTKLNDYKRFCQIVLSGTFFLFFIISPFLTRAQAVYSITGEIISAENNEAVMFAHVALYDSARLSLLHGTISNISGNFILENIEPGTYQLQVSAVGFSAHNGKVELGNNNIMIEPVALKTTDVVLNSVEVTASRIKASSASDRTVFFISRSMQESSNSATDLLKLIPGVRIDLQQNLSLEGSSNILLLVDGKERDRSYLSQLHPSSIDKIEVMTAPPARYDANVSGVINVVLKKDTNKGTDGHVSLEIPTSDSEIFLNPSYSLNYGFGRFNLFTSYNGDIRQFNITESYLRETRGTSGPLKIESTGQLRQKTWSHRFHYGFDWFINHRNQLNFYAFYNPFSQELDGTTEVNTNGNGLPVWQANKDDEDINRSRFYSLWYKHLFNGGTDHGITFDISLYRLNADNTTTYSWPASGLLHEYKMQPDNRTIKVKADYSVPAGNKFMLNTGLHGTSGKLSDEMNESLQYTEKTFAGYATAGYRSGPVEASAGFRLEHFNAGNHPGITHSSTFLLPSVTVNYNLPARQNLKMQYRRHTAYPGFYQLNPAVLPDDPFTLSYGNPDLNPEIISQLNLEYSRSFQSHFVSARVYRIHTANAIRKVMALNEQHQFETSSQNLGSIRQTGLQISGSFGFGKTGINPYFRIYDMQTSLGKAAEAFNLQENHLLVYEAGLSAYATIRKNYLVALNFIYTSPVHQIQQVTFSDPLYFISLERTILENLKIGLTSGVPLLQTFVYQGSEIHSPRFSHYSTGKIEMSAIPLWIKVNYRFTSGEKRQRIDRQKQEPERELRKGF